MYNTLITDHCSRTNLVKVYIRYSLMGMIIAIKQVLNTPPCQSNLTID